MSEVPRLLPRRRDARRNYVALVAAAHEVFDELGVRAPLDQIAKRADVANATLYRHFPRRDALIAAAYAGEVEEVSAGLARAAALQDPWDAFVAVFDLLCSMQASSRGFGETLTLYDPELAPPIPPNSPQTAHIVEIIGRARAAGVLRADFHVKDIPPILWANARIIEATQAAAPDVWRRYLGFVLDGLHTGDRRRKIPAHMDEAQILDAMARASGREQAALDGS